MTCEASESDAFVDMTDDYCRERGEERYVRTLGPFSWISVYHRRTGFGHMEWETAICFRDPTTKTHVTGSPFIVRGDWREELATITEQDAKAWYDKKRPGNPNSFDAFLDAMQSAVNRAAEARANQEQE